MLYVVNAIGVVGAIICLLAYLLTTQGKIHSSSKMFLILNVIASLMLLFSLCFYFNLAAFLLEFAWLFISVMGLLKRVKYS
jgi:hypothetical protein